MSHATPIVFVVDDDVSVRESLELLIDSAGWQSKTFASAQEFLAYPRVPRAPSCLVIDVIFRTSMVSNCKRVSLSTGLTCRSSSSRVMTTCRDGPGDEGGSGRVLDEATRR